MGITWRLVTLQPTRASIAVKRRDQKLQRSAPDQWSILDVLTVTKGRLKIRVVKGVSMCATECIKWRVVTLIRLHTT